MPCKIIKVFPISSPDESIKLLFSPENNKYTVGISSFQILHIEINLFRISQKQVSNNKYKGRFSAFSFCFLLGFFSRFTWHIRTKSFISLKIKIIITISKKSKSSDNKQKDYHIMNIQKLHLMSIKKDY